jgi:stage II sporulation protein D
MLKKNHIPSSEPIIRVGIILPEDKRRTIDICLPENLTYKITTDSGSSQTATQSRFNYKLSNNIIYQKPKGKAKYWMIEPLKDQKIVPKYGLLVKKVISGRGFHWQKYLDVYLPGKIEIKIYDNSLLLINELPLEHYLTCVATAEMSTHCPAAFIEAQTIAARSWILSNIEQKHIHLTMDVCNDDCCQRYQGSGQLSQNSISSAQHTTGKILMYKNKICDTRYSKCCGGITENYSTIWDKQNIAYLQSVYDAPVDFLPSVFPIKSEEEILKWIDSIPTCFCSSDIVTQNSLTKYLASVDIKGSYFRWEKKYSQQELSGLLNEKLGINAKAIHSLQPLSRGNSGRINRIKIAYINQQEHINETVIEGEYNIRSSLDEKFLYSSCFYLQYKPGKSTIPEQFIIHGAGWGHGVGMCQIGALGMALQGYTSGEILRHYYRGSELVKIY